MANIGSKSVKKKAKNKTAGRPRESKKGPKETKKKQEQQKKDKLARPNLVIGLTGPFGSGCGEMRKVLESLNFHAFKISDDIRGELNRTGELIEKGKQNWRKVLQDHGNKKRKEDQSYWINKVVGRINEANIGNDKVVIDGFRNFQEVQKIREIYPIFFLVAVCAEKNERWQRVKKDYDGYNEFERDDRRDRSEDFDWGQNVQKCVDDADYVYNNNENFFVYPQGEEEPNLDKIGRTLEKQAEEFVGLMQEVEGCRGPNPEEVQMAAAYAQSNSSKCRKRHVGAVITIKRNGQEFPISMGFNENPPRVPTCYQLQVCCKDEDMAAKLKARGRSICCPLCGKRHTDLSEPWLCECGENLKECLYPNRNMELCTAIHAEERAILSLGGRSSMDGRLYATTFPCFQCARLIIDAGICEVVYVEAYPTKETAEFLEKNGVRVKPFIGFTARSFFRVFKKID
ncbi:MAG: AAA family ATPase [Sedimentisphaerales bacterium]|nr:AAA family ATPase [Sedimentisphaerales bacterium]